MATIENRFTSYLDKIFKEAYPKATWTKDAKDYMNDLTITLAQAIIDEAVNLATQDEKKTLMVKHIALALRIVIYKDVSVSAVEFARESTQAFEKTKPAKTPRGKKGQAASPRAASPRSPRAVPAMRSPRLRKQQKAGILMPVARIHKMIKATTALRVQEEASIYLSAALQEVCRQIFAVSVAHAVKQKRTRVTAEFIYQAIQADIPCLF